MLLKTSQDGLLEEMGPPHTRVRSFKRRSVVGANPSCVAKKEQSVGQTKHRNVMRKLCRRSRMGRRNDCKAQRNAACTTVRHGEKSETGSQRHWGNGKTGPKRRSHIGSGSGELRRIL